MLDIELPFETHVDFCGQKIAERLFQVIVTLFGIVGFIGGYFTQQFSLTIYSVLFGVLISAVLTLPAWPMYRNNPVDWIKSTNSNKDAATSKASSTAKSPKKDVRKPKVKKDE